MDKLVIFSVKFFSRFRATKSFISDAVIQKVNRVKFLARDVLYISRLCYDVSVRLSVCLSVCDGSALAHYS